VAKSTAPDRKDAKGGAARKGSAKKASTSKKPAKSVAKGAKKSAKGSAKQAKPRAKAPAKVLAKSAKPAASAKSKGKVESKSKGPVPKTKDVKPVPAGKTVPPKTAGGKAVPATAAAAADDKKGAPRKGITIVAGKPAKKSGAKPSMVKIPEYGTPLSQTIRTPLIASGPNAPKPKTFAEAADDKPRKSPFSAKELAFYKQLLLHKRLELIGDVSGLENEALMAQSGSLSNLPQHMAEQGSDAYGQSLSLDLAAADRRLIKEIDDALQRIEKGTFGVCELTGKPIRKERLEELPWARYSIEAARELERRSTSL
jgi:DnaK suppressor protein